MPIPTQDITVGDVTMRLFTTTGKRKVPYLEAREYSEDFSRDNSSAMRTVYVHWKSREAFRRDILGTASYRPGATFGGVVSNLDREIPEAHPEISWLFATALRFQEGTGLPTKMDGNLAETLLSYVDWPTVEGFSKDDPDGSNMVRWALAKYQIEYTAPTWYVLPNDPDGSNVSPGGTGELGRYVFPLRKSAAEALTVPGAAYKFTDNKVVPGGQQTITQYSSELHYTWIQVPQVNAAKLDSFLNCVNKTQFDGFPPGTLLFMGYDPGKPYVGVSGDFFYDVDLMMQYRPQGHNYLFSRESHPDQSPSASGYYLVTKSGKSSGDPPFGSKEFSDMFVL